MGWYRSHDTTKIVVAHREFSGTRAVDGRYYFDLPMEMASHAGMAGMLPSSGPPPDPEPPINRAEMVREITEEVERRLMTALAPPHRA